MELVMVKTECGWKWVLDTGFNVSGFRGFKESGQLTRLGDFDINPHFSRKGRARNGAPDVGTSVESICAVAEENWWEVLRGDPKRLGEVSQAAFLLKARMLGLSVAIPWGDSDPNDFVVWARTSRKTKTSGPASRSALGCATGPKTTSKAAGGGARATRARATYSKILRVQVKGTGRLYRRGYEVQPVRSTRGGGKKRYTKRDIDVLVAHVQPVDAWYVIPIEKVGRAKSLRLYPGIESRNPRWEQWRDRWDVLGK